VRRERDGQDPAELAVTAPPLVLAGCGRPIPARTRITRMSRSSRWPGRLVIRACWLMRAGRRRRTGFQVFGYPSEGGAEVIPLVGLLPRIAVGGRAGPGTGDQCRSCQKATHRLVPGLW